MKDLQNIGLIPIDYSILETIFKDYASPRNKIAQLEKTGQLIRLKRGMYVVSSILSGKILSTELIANHIYGPSYVSMESALRFYGLIPESVHIVRSMTLKRSRNFENTISRFEYLHAPSNYYPIGIKQVRQNNYTFLIASPEKALCDLIAYTHQLRLRFVTSMLQYLEDDLRLDMEQFYKMDINIFRECAKVSKKQKDINNIIKLLER